MLIVRKMRIVNSCLQTGRGRAGKTQQVNACWMQVVAATTILDERAMRFAFRFVEVKWSITYAFWRTYSLSLQHRLVHLFTLFTVLTSSLRQQKLAVPDTQSIVSAVLFTTVSQRPISGDGLAPLANRIVVKTTIAKSTTIDVDDVVELLFHFMMVIMWVCASVQWTWSVVSHFSDAYYCDGGA